MALQKHPKNERRTAKVNSGRPDVESDNFRFTRHQYWESSLFSEVYLQNDLKRDFHSKWSFDLEDVEGFYFFFNEFKNIASDLRAFSQKKLSETETINKIIKPVLYCLGWYENCARHEEPLAEETSFSHQEDGKSKTYRTDILLVDHPREATYIGEPREPDDRKREARRLCIVPVEAKYWNRIADGRSSKFEEDQKRSKKQDDTSKSFTPNQQILKYMEILHKKWGVVTDGNIWRLLNSDVSSEAPERCYEFKLEALLAEEEFATESSGEFLDAMKRFYHFFCKQSFVKDAAGRVFLDDVLSESRKYIDKIEEDLQDRFISAMNIACNGFLRSATDSGHEPELAVVRSVAESHLFNILFIKSCEARGILPLKAPDFHKISLSNIIDRIEDFDPKKYHLKKDIEYIDSKLKDSLNAFNYSPTGTGLYKNLLRLTKVIHDGTEKANDFGFEVAGFKESIFTNEEWAFANKYHLHDIEMVRILFELGYSEANSALQRKYQQIPYNYFTPRQLGSIYESFLEYRVEKATHEMVFHGREDSKQWTELTAAIERKLKGGEPRVKRGQLFFSPDNEERRATGSYYTPDWVTQFIVEKCLGPHIKGLTSMEILELKICDPAMGSGHFLNNALAYLANSYIAAVEREEHSSAVPSFAEAKRIVLDSCIFGVDINPRAVKLAKMSLWLTSAYQGKKLGRLDGQIFHGNSVIPKSHVPASDRGRWKSAFDWGLLKTKEMFFIGNPPWGAKLSNETKQKIGEIYGLDIDNLNIFEAFLLLPSLLKNRKTMYIIPRNFIRTDGYEFSRKKLIENQTLISIADFGACFPKVTQEAVTLEYSPNESETAKVALMPNAKNRDFNSISYIEQKQIAFDKKCRFNLLHTDTLERVARKIESNTSTLGGYVEHFRGIEYGKDGGVTECSKCGHHNSLPKKKNKTKSCHNCGNKISIEAAKVYNFISKSKSKKHHVPIVVGKVIDRFECKEFYYMEPGIKGVDYKEHAFKAQDKIMMMKISDSLKAYLDRDHSYATQGIYMLYGKGGKKIQLGTLLGILNSPLMSFYYAYRINMGAELTTNVVLEDILALPFPSERVLESEVGKEIALLVDNAQAVVKSGKSDKLPSIENEISDLVYKLYDVQKDDRKQIDSFADSVEGHVTEHEEADDAA